MIHDGDMPYFFFCPSIDTQNTYSIDTSLRDILIWLACGKVQSCENVSITPQNNGGIVVPEVFSTII